MTRIELATNPAEGEPCRMHVIYQDESVTLGAQAEEESDASEGLGRLASELLRGKTSRERWPRAKDNAKRPTADDTIPAKGASSRRTARTATLGRMRYADGATTRS